MPTRKKGIKVTKTESTVIKPIPAKEKYTSLGGEIGRPTGPSTGRRETTIGSAKKGASIKKAQNGTKAKSSLGMKSVNAGYDDNSGVTRADFVSIGKGKAKNGTSVPKNNSVSKNIGNLNKAKSGKSMKKCKYGCK
jgi:hypothetical protein